ncbi:hypothetical protein BLNAU_9369 [Blattamonas nauphoetae]|uniref:Uncharacterized protein n=1 Tax=Blattamonas nauphoetae TaxID=2049346 RepID=A0ABQ9XW19_9EUKA|nr:hypothetical protein BLNAU_9369 [Blattamonas nauphoetae]
MEMLESLTLGCSARVLYLLIQADLFPQLLTTLNPLSLSFSEGVDIHTNIVKCIINSLWLSTPDGLADIKCEDEDEVQDVHETILTHVLAPSEKYIWLLCLNRFSINDGDQSKFFLGLLAQILRICPYHQPAMDFVLQMPVFLTIPSCLTFFEHDRSIWYFLYEMIDAQLEWNATKGKQQQMWKKVRRMLRMEGIEDVVEEKLQNDQNGLIALQIRQQVKDERGKGTRGRSEEKEE